MGRGGASRHYQMRRMRFEQEVDSPQVSVRFRAVGRSESPAPNGPGSSALLHVSRPCLHPLGRVAAISAYPTTTCRKAQPGKAPMRLIGAVWVGTRGDAPPPPSSPPRTPLPRRLSPGRASPGGGLVRRGIVRLGIQLTVKEV